MARNRKRAKERRSRRSVPGPGARPGVATARGDATARAEREAREAELDGLEETPGPLEHATPDAELAEAQLALGRPEYADEHAEYAEDDTAYTDDQDVLDNADAGAELAHRAASPAPRVAPGPRLITFLQGSWRELQRVQWPDRRQVMQATGVVLGFVIVAGLFLGLADTVAGKLVNLILK